jgi:hypothetical protein
MNVVITQLHSTHNNVKTKTFKGKCECIPTVGECFYMLAEAGHFTTTKVTWVMIHYGEYYFKTQNSSYKLNLQ